MSDMHWGLGRRIAFRFGVIFGALVVFPFPLSMIPWLPDSVSWPTEALPAWVTEHVFGVVTTTELTGSGDRMQDYVALLTYAVLAAVGALVWSLVDRRRAHPRLAELAIVVLRYFLAAAILHYGVSKILKSQFPDPIPGTLDQRVGDLSPMRLIWTFMGYSKPYTVFAGIGEAVGAVLLLWRRTATLGALIVAIVMTNVVMINFCYDVPVKLGSSTYLGMAIAIALPSARRVMAAVLGYAAPAVPDRPRMSPRAERVRKISKGLFLALLAYATYAQLANARPRGRAHELQGTWIVDTFTADGVDHPPLTTDPLRWMRMSANPRALWLTTMTGVRTWRGLTVDPVQHTLQLAPQQGKSGEAVEPEATWAYALQGTDRLVLDGIHLGHRVHATLHLEPPGLLMTRGFHWINEVPFNR